MIPLACSRRYAASVLEFSYIEILNENLISMFKLVLIFMQDNTTSVHTIMRNLAKRLRNLMGY